MSKVIMGNQDSQFFVVIGRAVDEVRLAEGLAVAGNIILSPNAWELCDRANIAFDPFEDKRAVKVRPAVHFFHLPLSIGYLCDIVVRW